MKKWIHAATYSGFDEGEFDNRQMREIREGLESGIDVSQYADPNFSADQMGQIRSGLESGIDVSKYADPKFDVRQMYYIKRGLRSGFDVSKYADPKFDGGQMAQIVWGLESGVDVSQYANPNISGDQMSRIRERLEKGLPANNDRAIDTVNKINSNSDLVNFLKSKGIDTTKQQYELQFTFYDRFDTEKSKFKFTCPGDYLALFSTILTDTPKFDIINEWCGIEDFVEIVDENPTFESLHDYGESHEWFDREEFGNIKLTNLTTNKVLAEGRIDDEWEDEWEDEWDD